MNTLPLNVYGITLHWEDDPTAATITSDLHDDCWSSHLSCAFDAIESFVLAFFCAGGDVLSPDFLEAIETAVQACEANIG